MKLTTESIMKRFVSGLDYRAPPITPSSGSWIRQNGYVFKNFEFTSYELIGDFIARILSATSLLPHNNVHINVDHKNATVYIDATQFDVNNMIDVVDDIDDSFTSILTNDLHDM
jgi:hypothetical protein